ncbi:MAG: hypothetical protein ACJ8G1_17525 [Vitreoscilla sp.]
MAERLLLLIAVIVIAWLAMVLVRVENQRYAMAVGMCQDKMLPGSHDYQCMKAVETRTGWWWHIYYAAKEFGEP